jgi:hypothetical protein
LIFSQFTALLNEGKRQTSMFFILAQVGEVVLHILRPFVLPLSLYLHTTLDLKLCLDDSYLACLQLLQVLLCSHNDEGDDTFAGVIELQVYSLCEDG